MVIDLKKTWLFVVIEIWGAVCANGVYRALSDYNSAGLVGVSLIAFW